MENMISSMVTNGGPSAIILGLGILWVNGKIKELKIQIEELKKDKRWSETCEKTHDEVNRRLNRLEVSRNGDNS